MTIETKKNSIIDIECPKFLTSPCANFWRDLILIIQYTQTIIQVSNIADKFGKQAADLQLKLNLGELSQEQKQQLELHAKHGYGFSNLLSSIDQFILQNIFCKTVDNYLCYLSELLYLIFQTKPNMLKSSDEIPIEIILQYPTMEDLISHIAEAKVHNLAYKSIKDLVSYLSKQFTFDLFTSTENSEKMSLINQYRNLIIHNRGIVNRKFLASIPKNAKVYKIGDKIEIKHDVVFGYIEFLTKSVFDIDKRSTKKFHLSTQTLEEHKITISKDDWILSQVRDAASLKN